jgi:hypothetical protein
MHEAHGACDREEAPHERDTGRMLPRGECICMRRMAHATERRRRMRETQDACCHEASAYA